jgi:DNA helicase-2/ATP-dependent DNA helicase PcrA
MTPSPEQLAAITSPAERLALKAGAGSGKSFTLVRRIIHAIDAGADPAKIVAISFTVQAGRILADRLKALGAPPIRHSGTIHALALSESHKWPTWGNKRPIIIDEEAQAAIIKAEIARLRMGNKVSAADVAATLAAGQVNDAAKPVHSNPAWPVAKAVRRAMVAAGQASMDVLLGEAIAYLPGSLGRLDAVFWDEFQDSAPGDFELLNRLDAEAITIVGDTMQSIFSFRGTRPEYFNHLAATWECLTLADNYRSNRGIVDAANRLTGGNRYAVQMRATREAEYSPPRIANYALESTECAAIREWLDAHPTGTRAILCRHNALAERLRVALADAVPPAQAHAIEPAMIRRAMAAVQGQDRSAADWLREAHDLLPYVRHFTDLCGTAEPEILLPAMAEALAQAETTAAYDHAGLYIGTVHGAKGLEWDHVLIAGAEQAAWPDTDEALRLFYVAVTRARDSLTITCARKRPALHGKGWTESEMANVVGKL